MSLVLLWVDASGKPRVRVLRGSIRIGRSMEAEVRLTDPSVAPLHATIDAGVSPPVVTAVAPLLVNEMPVRSQSLREGDVLRFGKVEVTVSEAAGEATNPDPAGAAVPVRRGPPVPISAPSRAPAATTTFPFAQVAAVTIVIFGAAWAINSARTVKWRAPLDAEDARSAVQRAGGIRKPLEAATEPSTPTSPPREGRVPEAAVPFGRSQASPPPRADNSLGLAVRTVVSLTGEVRVDGQMSSVLGSGVFITETGLILTNAHVMDHEGDYRARTHDGRYLNLVQRERDRTLDLGLLAAIGEGPFETLNFGNTKTMAYGDQVWAIGSPLSAQLGFSVTRGVVSSPLRVFNGRAYIQHDAAINPGNSGGPLVDAAGRLVGINTWKVTGGGAQGLGFAIPIEVVEEVLKAWKVKR